MGTPGLTTRGFQDGEFLRVAELFDRAEHIAIRLPRTLATYAAAPTTMGAKMTR
jgi:hypothetical protein